MNSKKPRILLTNDDGIDSPGLWAAVAPLAELGELWICAPKEQRTSFGRSTPPIWPGTIEVRTIQRQGKEWKAYSVDATPAQVVQFAILEIMPEKPDLVISGINYGANTGNDITRSGTIGAAIEAACFGIKAIASSFQVAEHETFTHSTSVDFSVAASFTALFARKALIMEFPKDVDILKVEVPTNARKETPWEVVPSTSGSLYLIKKPERKNYEGEWKMSYRMETDYSKFPSGTDSHSVFVKEVVAITPLSVDLGSRTELDELDSLLRSKD